MGGSHDTCILCHKEDNMFKDYLDEVTYPELIKELTALREKVDRVRTLLRESGEVYSTCALNKVKEALRILEEP